MAPPTTLKYGLVELAIYTTFDTTGNMVFERANLRLKCGICVWEMMRGSRVVCIVTVKQLNADGRLINLLYNKAHKK